MRVIVSQKGAREGYLAARSLHRMGMLARLVTDWYAPSGEAWKLLGRTRWRALSRALGARSDELPAELIEVLRIQGLKGRIGSQLAGALGRTAAATLRSDIAYASAVARLELPEHDAFFGYSYASLETLRSEQRKGKLCILDQIDPGQKEHEIIRAEQVRWPQYVDHPEDTIPSLVYERLHEEWKLADIILVNSEWSRQCNIDRGAPTTKIHVIPLALEIGAGVMGGAQLDFPGSVFPGSGDQINILWVGRITLQKGIQYLVEAARQLRGDRVRFLVAGERNISRRAIAESPSNIQWLGKVSAAEKEALFRVASAFVLPTLSDGFALTQLEALARGIPLIVTPRCGAVVEDGKTGFVIPGRDSEALAVAVKRFIDNPGLTLEMAPLCREAVRDYSVEAYGRRLLEIMNRAGIPVGAS